MRDANPRERRVTRVLDAVTAFLYAESVGAVVLLVAALTAIAWVNSPLAPSYRALWETPTRLAFGERVLISLDLRHWVSDGLMALFFFVVGLEIKRELVRGELSSREKAVLPAIAALGGMVVPAFIYVAFNLGGGASRAWGIPMATDIAFAVGVLALLGRRIPSGLRVLLLALAIADDIGTIVVIAIFYTERLDPLALGVALAALAGVVGLWRVERHWSDPPMVALMFLVWAATLASGVHATIAGVALGLLTPARGTPQKASPAERLEETLHPWTSYIVVPLFALANAGVEIDPTRIASAVASPVGLGIALGLALGKPVGIAGAALVATRTGIASLPRGIDLWHLVGAASIAGIGFTVSLFIAQLALMDELLDDAKVGIFAGSLLSALAGTAILLLRARRR